MLTLNTETTKGTFTVHCPQSWDETTVEQYQRIIAEWDGEDYIQLFSILTGLDVNHIQRSTDNAMEGALYECVRFVLNSFSWDDLKAPEHITLQPLFLKDSPLVPDQVKVPKKIGRLSIGQAIQARKSLEGIADLRIGIAKVTAIYLQPLVDESDFDMLRVIELESIIEKMPITKIYPIGFFLLRRLNESGKKHISVWSQIINWMKGQGT